MTLAARAEKHFSGYCKKRERETQEEREWASFHLALIAGRDYSACAYLALIRTKVIPGDARD